MARRSSGTNSYQVYPVLVPDDAGGAIVLWRDEDHPPTRVFVEAQRIGATGLTLWNPDGVETIGQYAGHYPALRDGAGGAFIVAEAYGPSGADIVAQRLDQNGALPWGANGAAVCMAPGAQRFPSMVPDGAGGVIAVWEDFRDVAAGGDSSLYAQRVNGSGVTQWSVDGVRVYFFPGDVVGLPAAPGPALEPIRPNPAVGPLTISFSLVSSRPATLEMLDVRGRRLATRTLSMAAGPHTLRWEYGASIHAGIYFVRLIQDQQAITRKVCVLR